MPPTTTTSPSSNLSENSLAVSVAAGLGVCGFLLWNCYDRITTWSYAHGLYSTTPLFAAPGPVPGIGPTWQCAFAAVITAFALVLATLAVVIYFARRPRIPITPTLTASTAAALTCITWLLLLMMPSHHTLALLLAAGLTGATATAAHRRAVRSLRRADVTALLNDRARPHLGYPTDYRRPAVDVDAWDPSSVDPVRPQTLTIKPAKSFRVTDRTLSDLADVINQCATVHTDTTTGYALTYDLVANAIRGAIVDTKPQLDEPEQIRKLRAYVAKPAYFEEGATVHNIRVHRATGEIVAFDVHHNISDKLVESARPRSIERRLGLLISKTGRWRATNWDWTEGTVHFQRRRELPRMILPTPVAPVLTPRSDATEAALETAIAAARRHVIDTYDDTEFLYGIDEDGNKLSWCPRILAHTLTIGATGSGKTSVTQTIIAAATACGWPVIIIDFKGIEYVQFRDWPNVTMIIDTIESAVAVIHHFATAMDSRYTAVKRDETKLKNMMPFLLVIDEYAEFMAQLNTFYTDTKPAKKAPRVCPTIGEIDSILRKSRSSRMHAYFGLQRPDQKIMESGAGRDQLTHRISVGPLTSQGAMMMWGSGFIGRTVPVGVRGRATGKNRRGEPVEFQCYYTPNPGLDKDKPELVDFFESMRPPAALWPRQVVEHPDPDAVDEGEPDFFYYQTLKVFNAADRPDLDPLSEHFQPPHTEEGLADYDVSSGLLGHGAARTTHATSSHSFEAADDVEDEFTWEDAYDNPIDRAVTELAHGDLIRIDPDTDQWVLLDGEPEHVDDNHIALYWRDVITGEEGDTQLAVDAAVQVRPERELVAA